MKRYSSVIFFLLIGICIGAQSIPELETRLKNASNSIERMHLMYEIGEKYIGIDYGKAKSYLDDAYKVAQQSNDKDMLIRASYLDADIHKKQGEKGEAAERFLQCADHASAAGQTTIAVSCLQELIAGAEGVKNHRVANQYAKRAINLLMKNKPAVNSSKPANSRVLVREKAELDGIRSEKERLSGEIAALSQQRNELMEDKGVLEFIQTEMQRDQTAFDSLTVAKAQSDQSSSRNRRKLKQLLKDKVTDSVVLNRIIMDRETELEEAELVIARDTYLRYLLLALSVLVLSIATLFYSRYRSKKAANIALKEKNRQVEKAKNESDQLLLNILPTAIAEELKKDGKAKARKYEMATVLFTDFKNFSTISASMTPEHLVSELDKCFKSFDYIISQYKIEKIKTIGDSYMCASGLSDKNATPMDMIRAALDMQEYLNDVKKERVKYSLPCFEARIGLHTGPVVAGVVGINKFAYDIWGETVNIASRMEEKGMVGKVTVSEDTYELVKNQFHCTSVGKVALKNRRFISMYSIDGLKS